MSSFWFSVLLKDISQESNHTELFIFYLYLQSVVLVLQVFDAESLSFNLLRQQRRVDHLDARTRTNTGHHVRCEEQVKGKGTEKHYTFTFYCLFFLSSNKKLWYEFFSMHVQWWKVEYIYSGAVVFEITVFTHILYFTFNIVLFAPLYL